MSQKYIEGCVSEIISILCKFQFYFELKKKLILARLLMLNKNSVDWVRFGEKLDFFFMSETELRFVKDDLIISHTVARNEIITFFTHHR